LPSRGYLIGYGGGYTVERYVVGLTTKAVHEFNLSFSNASSDVDSIRDTD
jgi:hypothetical protein